MESIKNLWRKISNNKIFLLILLVTISLVSGTIVSILFEEASKPTSLWIVYMVAALTVALIGGKYIGKILFKLLGGDKY